MSGAGEMYADEVARHYYERGTIEGLDGSAAVWGCDECGALVVHADRQRHFEWHKSCGEGSERG